VLASCCAIGRSCADARNALVSLMLRAVGAFAASLRLAAIALALIRELVREIVLWIAPAVFFRTLTELFAAGFLLAAAAPAFAFFAAGFFAVESACAVSAAAPPAAIRTTGHSSTLSSAIVRNLFLFPNRLTPQVLPALNQPKRPRIEPTL
jgi:hypothetical protein